MKEGHVTVITGRERKSLLSLTLHRPGHRHPVLRVEEAPADRPPEHLGGGAGDQYVRLRASVLTEKKVNVLVILGHLSF